MKRLAHTIVDTVIWLIHGTAFFFVVWLYGHAPAALWIAISALCGVADWAATRPLARLADNIQSRTVV